MESEGKKDRFNRIIAEIILQDHTNLNKELIKAGFAWHYKKYSSNQEYAKLEVKAGNNQWEFGAKLTRQHPGTGEKIDK